MPNSYLDWIKDEDLVNAVKQMHKVFVKAATETTLNRITRNVIDPFAFVFETSLLSELNIKQWIADESKRQIQKTLTNALGDFHQTVLGSVDGWTNLKTGHSTGLDLMKDDGTVFAEIKNKFNTLTGSRRDSVFNVLQDTAKKNPKATCYLVHIIRDKEQPYDKEWVFKARKKKYSHSRVRLISGDNFYNLVAGDNSLYQLLKVLPSVINEHVSNDEKITMGEIEAVQELAKHVGEKFPAEEVIEYMFSKAYPNSN
jgi:Eco47II restriction endonuclease